MSAPVPADAPHAGARRSAAASGRRQRLTPPPTTSPSLPGRDRRHRIGGRQYVDGLEVGRADDFEVFHVPGVIEPIMGDARPLMNDVAGLHQTDRYQLEIPD